MLLQFIRFVGVGALATAVQYVVLIALMESHLTDVIMASMIGYIISSILNYLLNYYFTFNSSEKHVVAALKFTMVAIVGLGLNGVFMYIGFYLLSFHYLLSQLIATGFVLIWNFSVNRYWTYRARAI